LRNVAVAVVVELDPDKVQFAANILRLRGIREGALRSGTEEVALARIVLEVGLEALDHSQVTSGVARFIVCLN
jgi:hypothetical protein